MSEAPTYSLRPTGAASESYLTVVARLADKVLGAGDALRPMLDDYGEFLERSGVEERRSPTEYMVEALTLGVLWRARGQDATAGVNHPGNDLVELLVRERMTTGARSRDGSTARLVSLGAPYDRLRADLTLANLRRLLDWLVASGEYDDEVARLEGWEKFVAADPSLADERLGKIVALAFKFETMSMRALGGHTAGVDRFVDHELVARGWREDTVQCSRRQAEYHHNMVGAELLNRAWRAAFLGCRRHVVVLPGCARRRPDGECCARRSATELRCVHCTVACIVSSATRAAVLTGAEALAVVHGSDFSRFLRSPALRGGDVGIVGVACVPGLVGAGWRARANGLPAQCVLLDASGCAHWRDVPVPTALDLHQLARVLRRENIGASRVA